MAAAVEEFPVFAGLKCGDEFVCLEGITMTVCQLGYGRITLAELNAGATPTTLTATEDGLHANTLEWHDGPGEGAETAIFVERYVGAARIFHGWVDQTTRKLLQAG